MRPSFVIILSLFFSFFLSLVKVVYASDLCTGTSSVPPIGQICKGGAIYAGTGNSSEGLNPEIRYMVTPSGCSDEFCTGAGAPDGWHVIMAYATGYYASHSTGAVDLNNGKVNTATLVGLHSTTPAALWCAEMNYGGYTDWYLPSINEVNAILFTNLCKLSGSVCTGSGGLMGSSYWSSSESSATLASYNSSGFQFTSSKTADAYVRCVRSY